MTKLPEAEKLCAQLIAELKPHIGPKTAMVGLYTGGAWLAERLQCTGPGPQTKAQIRTDKKSLQSRARHFPGFEHAR